MQSFIAFGNLKRYLLASFEGFVALHSDGGIVCKQVFTAFIRKDKAVTFRIIEPFDGASWHDWNPSAQVMPLKNITVVIIVPSTAVAWGWTRCLFIVLLIAVYRYLSLDAFI
jgi:hypothetical protein